MAFTCGESKDEATEECGVLPPNIGRCSADILQLYQMKKTR